MNMMLMVPSTGQARWRTLKRVARRLLQVHLPADGVVRPLFALLYALHVALREGLAWLLRFCWYEPLFRSQCVVVGAGFQMEQLPYMQGRGRIVLGSQVRLSGKPNILFSNVLHEQPEFVVGDHTFIGHACGFNIGESVRIGQHCLLASGVQLYDFDGHPTDAARRRANEPSGRENIKPVVIGDDVWVGAAAFILKGVTIGDRSIVAARSVVTRDVPPDTLVAGNPARPVKRLTPADNPCRAAQS